MASIWTFLDGRVASIYHFRSFCAPRGENFAKNFVNDAARVIRDEFVALDAENPNFNVVAFVRL